MKEGHQEGVERLIDEVLEALWLEAEERAEPGIPKGGATFSWERMGGAVEEALRLDLVQRVEGRLSLTPVGAERGRGLVRRHRLAERLLHDVLDMGAEEVESRACEYEHLLTPEAANSVCILLGHPTACPHGRPIPRGPCCQKGVAEVRPLVFPASRLRVGEGAVVAYVGTRDRARLEYLTNLGIIPGNKLRLEQRFPAYVVLVDQTHLGLDDEVVREIYVRPRR
ncbi:MAG: metal-dependent transcriptional regulator [Chloroflexota bacterium]|nr:metal-dependent transcriptional regulator [Chloroflexota bacterium]